MNPGMKPENVPSNALESSRKTQDEQTQSLVEQSKKIAAMEKVLADTKDPALKEMLHADIAKLKTPVLMKALSFTTDPKEKAEILNELAQLTNTPPVPITAKLTTSPNGEKKGNNQPNPFQYNSTTKRGDTITGTDRVYRDWDNNAQ